MARISSGTEFLVELVDLAPCPGIDPVENRRVKRAAAGVGDQGAGADPADADRRRLPRSFPDERPDHADRVVPPDRLGVLFGKAGLRLVESVLSARAIDDLPVPIDEHGLRRRRADVDSEHQGSHADYGSMQSMSSNAQTPRSSARTSPGTAWM